MKCILFMWLAAIASVYGQERIYIVTRTGGSLNGGTILSLDPQTGDINVNLNFGKHLAGPRHINMKGTDGFLYGLAGGGNATGGIFKIMPGGAAYEQIFDFGNEEGVSDGGMTISDEGIIYGSTFSRGANGGGVIFSINQDGTGYKTLHNFTWGLSNPQSTATMIIGSDGLLYGTHHIGSSTYGSLYALAKDGSDFKEILKFNSVDMEAPAGLLQGIDGKLYGLSEGSAASLPQLFRLNTDGSGFEAIHTFPAYEELGYGIHQGNNGRIYGTLTGNDGAIFSCEPDGSDYQVLHNFSSAEGTTPSGGIIQASNGFLYGRTISGGAHGLGSVFRLQPDGSAFAVLSHSALGSSSSVPYVDDAGAVYGFTFAGGQYNKGTLFKVDEGSEQIVYHFGAPDETSYYPYEGVTEVDDKFLAFATPRASTPPFEGTIVGIASDQTLITLDLPITPKSTAISRPVKGSDGFLYATTPFGGSNSQGLLFRTKADGSSYSPLHNFSLSTGASPYGELLIGLDGRVYGTCLMGGDNNFGVIYAMNYDGTNYTVLRHFSYPTGEAPTTGLIQASDGTIYGSAKNVFRINPDGTNYQQLHDFQNNEIPTGELTLVGNYLYGALATGGSASKGALFRMKVDGSDYSVVHSFNGADGERPYTSILPYAGALYGATSHGGAFGLGTIYKLDASGEGFTKIIDLNHFTGGQPSGDMTGKCLPAPKPAITLTNNLLTSSAPFGNQWYKDGILIAGANDVSYEAASNGIYTVAVNLSGCPGAISDGTLVNVTAVENEERQSSMQFYPNPTDSRLFVTLPSGYNKISSITMFDAVGNTIFYHEDNIKSDWQYDMSKYNKGIYIMRVRTGTTLTYTKIIKN